MKEIMEQCHFLFLRKYAELNNFVVNSLFSDEKDVQTTACIINTLYTIYPFKFPLDIIRLSIDCGVAFYRVPPRLCHWTFIFLSGREM